MKKDKNHIKLIQGGKEIIKSESKSEKEKEKGKEKERKGELDEKEKEKKSKRKEEFDPKMNDKNRIKLKNENKTAWNPDYDGWICGKKIYSSGKHEIKIKIDQFPNSKNESNWICLGVIKTENRENFIKKGNWEGTYYFETWWIREKLESEKIKNENGKCTSEKIYPENINLKKNDIFTIFLDMDQKKYLSKLMKKISEDGKIYPKK